MWTTVNLFRACALSAQFWYKIIQQIGLYDVEKNQISRSISPIITASYFISKNNSELRHSTFDKYLIRRGPSSSPRPNLNLCLLFCSPRNTNTIQVRYIYNRRALHATLSFILLLSRATIATSALSSFGAPVVAVAMLVAVQMRRTSEIRPVPAH